MKHSLLVAASCQIVPVVLHNLTRGASGSLRKNFSVASEAWLISASFRHLLTSALYAPDSFPSSGLSITRSKAGTTRQAGNPLASHWKRRHNTLHSLTASIPLPHSWRGAAVLTGYRSARSYSLLSWGWRQTCFCKGNFTPKIQWQQFKVYCIPSGCSSKKFIHYLRNHGFIPLLLRDSLLTKAYIH